MASSDFTVAMVAPCQLTHRASSNSAIAAPCTPCTLFDSTLHRHLCSSYKADTGDSGVETARPVRLAPNSTMSSWAISEAVGRPVAGPPSKTPFLAAVRPTTGVIRNAHAQRYLFEYRFNRRFHLPGFILRLAYAAFRTPPMSEKATQTSVLAHK